MSAPSGPASHPSASPSGPARSSTGASASASGRGLCVFDIAAGRFALDVALVGEVVPVERSIAVPRAPRAVLGLFNLRGLAVALVDVEAVLGLPVPAEVRPATAPLALVVRVGPNVLGALRVDTVVTVLSANAAGTTTPPTRDVDHAAIACFVTTPSAGTISVLDGPYLQQRLAALRPR